MKTQEKAISVFGKRMHELRKDRGWSQPELGKKIGTSGQIVGRYEMGRITPSIEVVLKVARVFEVTLDYLVGEDDMPDIFKDRAMRTRWHDLEELSDNEKERILSVVDSLIRDAKARETFKAS